MDTQRGTILVVDDDVLNRTLLATNLEEAGYTVETAEDGRQALEALRAEKVDVVLLDILMPEMDGYQVLDAIKRDEALKDLPVIVISAVDDMDSVVRCIEMGAADYLPKPFEPAVLRARIANSLTKKRLRDQEVEVLKHLEHLTNAAAAVESRAFGAIDLAETAARGDAVGQLARVFQHMAREVYAREQALEQAAREREALLQAQLAQMRAELQESDVTLDKVLDHTPPFDFLTAQEKAWLASRVEPLAFPAGWSILEDDTANSDRLLILMAGRVALSEGDGAGRQFEAPAVFGERAVFFHQRALAPLVSTSDVRCYALRGQDVRALVEANAMFRQAFATALRSKHHIFHGYEAFVNFLFARAEEGNVYLADLVETYRGLQSVLHRGSSSDALDLDALAYVIPRLPEAITSAQTLYLAEQLPAMYLDAGHDMQLSARRAKKHKFYEILPNKIMVLLRDRSTDTVDLITKLCIYGVEANKLRERLAHAHAEANLARATLKPQASAILPSVAETLPFSRAELERIHEIFGETYLKRLYEISAQAGQVALYFQKADHQYRTTAIERWLAQVRQGATELLGTPEMDDGLRVHIISSNTHSVHNCLSSWLHQHQAEILHWAEQHAAVPSELENPADRLYLAARSWLNAHPDKADARAAADRAQGIYRLRDESRTGIEVSLIDANALQAPLDPALRLSSFNRRTLILNIDYAYGQQAELIMRSLILLFGQRIHSISIFGKSGAVVGKRGDLLLPDQLLMQADDQLYPIPNHDLRPADFLAIGCTRPTHTGTLLTVLGTVMQSREMLYFYRHFYNAVGMEMEGAFYLREIRRALSLNLLPQEVGLRFAYYTSDTPLEADESLASNLSPAEGVPAVYAITRAVLRRIFAGEEA